MKTFTLDEANSMLPVLGPAVEKIMQLNEALKLISHDINSLLDLWGEELYDAGHFDNSYYTRLMKIYDATLENLQEEAGKVQGLGCLLKDPEKGLVDFYHEQSGQTVFLCWKYGEQTIRHWHSLEAGFNARQPVGITLKKR